MARQRADHAEYYGAEHRKKRRRWAIILKQQGVVICVFCHQLIYYGDKWDMDHKHDGPSHPFCNRGDGGRTARLRERARLTRSRNW